MGGLWSRGDGREDARWRKQRLTSGSNGGGGPPAAVGGGEGVHELHSTMGKVAAGLNWVMRVWMWLSTMSRRPAAALFAGGGTPARNRRGGRVGKVQGEVGIRVGRSIGAKVG